MNLQEIVKIIAPNIPNFVFALLGMALLYGIVQQQSQRVDVLTTGLLQCAAMSQDTTFFRPEFEIPAIASLPPVE